MGIVILPASGTPNNEQWKQEERVCALQCTNATLCGSQPPASMNCKLNAACNATTAQLLFDLLARTPIDAITQSPGALYHHSHWRPVTALADWGRQRKKVAHCRSAFPRKASLSRRGTVRWIDCQSLLETLVPCAFTAIALPSTWLSLSVAIASSGY